MSTACTVQAPLLPLRRLPRGSCPIDIFRGLTIAVMIFVNELAEVRGSPVVDLSCARQPGRDDLCRHGVSVLPVYCRHVDAALGRAAAQAERVAAAAVAARVDSVVESDGAGADPRQLRTRSTACARECAGMPGGLLRLDLRRPIPECLPQVAALDRAVRGGSARSRPDRESSVAFAIFRRARKMACTWIDLSYPEILGLIAFAYFAAAFLYIPTRRWRWAAPAWLVLLVALNVLSTAAAGSFSQPLFDCMCGRSEMGRMWPGDGGHGDGADLLWRDAGD